MLANHKQSILGPVWFVIQPIITSILFAVFFGLFARLTPSGAPRFLFYLSALVPWTFLSAVTMGVANCLTANSAVLSKVYFPRLIAPIVATSVAFLHFLLSFSVFIGFYFLYYFQNDLKVPLSVLHLPFIILLLANTGALGLGTGLLYASIGVRYRDFRFALPIVLQTWMFSTPIIYPSSVVPEIWRPIFFLNPMAGVVETFRYFYFGTPIPKTIYILQGFPISLLIVIIGLFAFNRTQRNFIDII